jgi:hypothetical protein
MTLPWAFHGTLYADVAYVISDPMARSTQKLSDEGLTLLVLALIGYAARKP